MGHPHRPRTRGSPPRRYCRAAVRPGTPPAPHPHRPMPSLPLHLAPPVAPPTLAVRGLEANPPRAARPIRHRRPPPATTIRSSPGSVPNALSGPLPVRHALGQWRKDSKRMRSTCGPSRRKGSHTRRTGARPLPVVSPTISASRCAEPARRINSTDQRPQLISNT